MEHHWFLACVAFNGLLVTLLALNVSRCRMRLRIANGDGGNVEMKKAIRAHGNAVEHVSIFALMALALSLAAAPAPLQAGLVGGFSLGRLLHAASMLRSAFGLRRVAAGLTYLAELGAVGWLLVTLL